MLAKIISAGRTDIGKKRDSNQDQFLVADLNKSMLVQSTSLNLEAQSRLYGMSHGKLLMVADGMGGHQGGNRASRMAIDLLINQLLNSMHWFSSNETDETQRETGFIEDLKKLMKHAHAAIEKEARAEVGKKGMGTTLTVAYVIWPWMYVLHAGDSRCYLLREGELRQLTRDHTVSNQLVEQGGMTAEEASHSRWSNVLYNALGAGAAEVVPEVHKVELRPEDTILLCTDGLYRHVRDNEIRDLLETELEPLESCRSLIDLANFRGGLDNITAVVARLGMPEDDSHPKTRVAVEVTLERLLGETTGFQPLIPSRRSVIADQPTPPDKPRNLPDTADFSKLKPELYQK
ncbi:MAG: protein phosphatase 2C domain-containing protein [Pirellulaceae bacterium]|nr:protein phosphatase 2C domain-containing protein [Pirellulaceae bacterium]